MHAHATMCALVVFSSAIAPLLAQEPTMPITVDNFVRAETDMYMAQFITQAPLGSFYHYREPTPIDAQTVIRSNRDTLYSSAVFDLAAGPVTITLPDVGDRFMSMQVISEDHYVPEVVYGGGSYTYDEAKVGTRYVAMAIRTLVDPNDPKDLEVVHALQDAIKIEQKNPGSFEVPHWDTVTQKKMRDALLEVGSMMPDSKRAFGTKDQVDPVRHLVGTAIGWGGNPEKDASYLNVTPAENNGEAVYTLSVKDVPVDGFWSVSVYNAEGYFEKNDFHSYSLNNITAEKGDGGVVTIQFGGCDGTVKNCLPIVAGWNYGVRMYRPRAEILDGTWTFPHAERLGGLTP